MKRVVVTGMGAISPLGNDWESIKAYLKSGTNAVQRLSELAEYEGLQCHLGAPAKPFELPRHYNRKTMRGMGRVATMAVRASELALMDADLQDSDLLQSGQMGVACGSSCGTPDAASDFARMIFDKSIQGIYATTYIKMMAHTAPVNIGVFLGLRGRVYTTSSGCTSGSQGIGFAYEAIRSGSQVAMLAGGAEELHATQVAVFDTLGATSSNNESPQVTPSPFDEGRDGLVLGEGACLFVLEELEHANARGARIYAELVGFGTNSDGAHVTNPRLETMAGALELALQDAGLNAKDIDYVNAHGTATDQGDVAESLATQKVLGTNVPISTLKGFMGHTLGACGSLEAMMAIHMMREGWFAPNLNLKNPDPRCAPLDYIMGGERLLQAQYIMSNNFAFGGINTSLIFSRWPD